MRLLRSPLAFPCALLVLLPSRLLAQQNDGPASPPVPEARNATVGRVGTPPLVDGLLDDEAWQGVPALGGFIQREPTDGAPASEPTEVRLVSDGNALYVGVWLFDSDPSGIVEGEAARDAQLDNSDAVLFILDTFRDQQNGFVFGTNPSGIEYDGQLSNEGRGGGFMGGGPGGFQRRMQSGALGGLNVNWDGSWDVATSRDAGGWYAEFRIPFATLRYGDGDVQEWGFNVLRRIRRRNEESSWAVIPRQFNLYRLQYAGTISGVEPPASRTAQLMPYALSSTSRDFEAGQADFATHGELGADGKLQLTQGLTLDLTYNTDFAQVEVDEAQTNLTRFSISFPEKRPFFLENAGFFSVGASGSELFFSRRIGIVSQRQVPIQGGGRLSGRVGGLNVGLFHIRTDELDGFAEGNDFSVARVAKELPNRSRIGAAFISRAGTGSDEDDFNRTFAMDGQVGIGEAITISSFLAKTETPGLDGRDHAFDVSGGFTNREWRISGGFRELGEDFNPEVGFVPRNGHRLYQTMVMRYIRPEGIPWLRETRPHFSYNTYRDIETGFEESSRWHVDSHFDSPSGFHFSPAFNWNREGLEEPFRITPDITVPAGTYDGWEAAWVFNTNESATVSFNGGVNWGSFLSGDRKGFSGTLTWRNGGWLTTSLRAERNDVELVDVEERTRSFTARLVAFKLGWFPTPRVYAQSLVQYSDQIDRWSANLRFGWLSTAGTGLFVVLNETQGVDALSGKLNRAVTIKYVRQFDVARW